MTPSGITVAGTGRDDHRHPPTRVSWTALIGSARSLSAAAHRRRHRSSGVLQPGSAGTLLRLDSHSCRLPPGVAPAAAAVQLNALDCRCGFEMTLGDVGPLSLTSVNTAAIPELARAGTAQFATPLSSTVALLLLFGCLTVGVLLLVRT